MSARELNRIETPLGGFISYVANIACIRMLRTWLGVKLRSGEDLHSDSYYDILEQIAQISCGDEYRHAFPAEHLEETALEKDLLDEPTIPSEDPDPSPHDVEKLVQAE